MIQRTLIIALLTAVTLMAHARGNPKLGAFSSHPIEIWDHLAGSTKPLQIPSPNHTLTVKAIYSETIYGDSDVRLAVSGAANGTVDLGPGVASELLWKPDGSAFLVTTSDQGANGSFRTLFVSASGTGFVTSWDLTSLIGNAFGQPYRCGWPEAPNVGGVGFTPSGDLLIAAQVIDHSNCDSFGTFVLYEVNPQSREIVRKYGQLEAKRLFHSELGEYLLAADDKCIRRPESCYVSTNHPERKNTR